MDFFRIKQSPVAAEFCHNIHDIRRFPEFHDRRIACKNRCFHIFKFILERIGCVTGLNDGLFCGHLAGRIHQQNGCLFIGQCFQLIQFTAVEGNGLFKSFCCSQNNIHDIVITRAMYPKTDGNWRKHPISVLYNNDNYLLCGVPL